MKFNMVLRLTVDKFDMRLKSLICMEKADD